MAIDEYKVALTIAKTGRNVVTVWRGLLVVLLAVLFGTIYLTIQIDHLHDQIAAMAKH